MSEPVGVAILTPMPLEFGAVHAHLSDARRIRHSTGTAAEVGTVPGVPWPVAVILTGEGNGDAGALAERVSAWLEPRILLVVGVAGSLKEDVALGDVVVATWVYGYHGGKQDKSGSYARPRAWRSGHRLTQAAGIVAAIGDGWAKSLDSQPAVHLKPIASGDVLLNSRTSPLRDQLREHYNDAVAIEMESAGVMAAASLGDRMPVLTVRGISDLADGRKHLSDRARLQPAAAAHAAAFAMALLRELPADFGTESGPRMGADVGAEPGLRADAAEADEPGPGWRPLSEPPPAVWPRDLGVPPPRGAAILELCVLPVVPGAPLTMRRLAALPAELTALGRDANLFAPDDEVSQASGPAAIAATAQAGFGVTRRHERCGWQPLPRDSLGSVLDDEDLTCRLATLLTVLAAIDVPPPRQAAVAAGVTPSVLLAEGRVGDMPRTSRGRTSQTPLRIPAADAVPWEQIAGAPADVAAELAARLLAAFRSRQR
jgi:nucleoside phosphorylase